MSLYTWLASNPKTHEYILSSEAPARKDLVSALGRGYKNITPTWFYPTLNESLRRYFLDSFLFGPESTVI